MKIQLTEIEVSKAIKDYIINKISDPEDRIYINIDIDKIWFFIEDKQTQKKQSTIKDTLTVEIEL